MLKLGHLNGGVVLTQEQNEQNNNTAKKHAQRRARNIDETLRHLSRWTPKLKDVLDSFKFS